MKKELLQQLEDKIRESVKEPILHTQGGLITLPSWIPIKVGHWIRDKIHAENDVEIETELLLPSNKSL